MRVAVVGICSVVAVASAHADVCRVTIARAPDDVREVVEGWVRAEPRCRGELEVRIVPTDGGLYLLALDGSGRSRERVVPDAQSAGALIASWAADDRVAAAPPALVDPIRERPAPIETPPEVARARRYAWGGWLTVTLVLSDRTNGLRVDADLIETGPLSFGIASAITHFRFDDGSQSSLDGRDIRGIAYVADTFRQGPLWLRAELGVGVAQTDAFVLDTAPASFMSYDTDRWSPLAEVSVLGGVNLGQRWALTAGGVATVFEQSYTLGWMGSSNQTLGELRRVGDVMAMVGIRCRL